MVSREYGWTDDQILDLTVRRFRQIVAAINRRKYIERREAISLQSWSTRQIATFIAAGYMTDGKGNPALDQAQALAYDKIEEAQLEEAQKRQASAPLPTASEPAPGSFERFMSSMGSPSRWAGAR